MDAGSYTIRDIGQLKIMAHPYRLRILHDLARGKFTVTQLAKKYGDTPAKVHHHVKKLEKAGLVKLVETREVSGILAKYYQAVAGDFDVDKSLLQTAEAQESAADSIERMLRLVYRRAKRGFERAVMMAAPEASDSAGTGDTGAAEGKSRSAVGAGADAGAGTGTAAETGTRADVETETGSGTGTGAGVRTEAEIAAGATEPAGTGAVCEPHAKLAGTLGLTYVRLKQSEVRELASRLLEVVRAYEDRRYVAGRSGGEGTRPCGAEDAGPASAGDVQPGPCAAADTAGTAKMQSEGGREARGVTTRGTRETTSALEQQRCSWPCRPTVGEGPGGRSPVEEESGSYAVVIMIFPDKPSDEPLGHLT